MMYEKVIARRYAKGLMLAADARDFETLKDQMHELAVAVRNHRDLAQVFTDPAFLPSDRKAVITSLAQHMTMLPVLQNFLLVLVDKGRLNLLVAIYDELVRFIDAHLGRIEAVIESAQSLDEEEINHITTALAAMSNKVVRAKTLVDESLLGGIRVEMAGMIFDGTVRAKLVAMKDDLLNA